MGHAGGGQTTHVFGGVKMQNGAAVGSNLTPGQVESSSTHTSTRPAPPVGAPGLEYDRFFTKEGIDPFDEIEWDVRSAVIGNEKGSVVFEQRDVEIPALLVPAGHQHRRLQVFPRHDRHAGARALRQAADRPRRRHHHRPGRAGRSTSRAKTTCRRSATT